jgi:aminomethyltransferase
MYLPLVYEDAAADYWSLINDVTIWDVACQRQIEITGEDAARFVQTLTPRNLSKMSIGQCKYVVLTAEDGGIVSDLVLLRLEENRFWLSIADVDVLRWTLGVAVNSGCKVQIHEADVSPLAIQGPKAEAVATELFGSWVHDMRYFWFRETELSGIPLLVARSGWSRQGGFELYLQDGQFGDKLWELVMEAGKPYSIAPAAPNFVERIESGLLDYGTDMTLENNPFEMRMDKFIDVEQEAQFIGKEALKRIKAEGISQKLVGIEISGEDISFNRYRWPILMNGEPSGYVTSATFSYRLEKNIALAMVSIDNTQLDTGLTVETPGGLVEAKVVPVPFIAPNN